MLVLWDMVAVSFASEWRPVTFVWCLGEHRPEKQLHFTSQARSPSRLKNLSPSQMALQSNRMPCTLRILPQPPQNRNTIPSSWPVTPPFMSDQDIQISVGLPKSYEEGDLYSGWTARPIELLTHLRLSPFFFRGPSTYVLFNVLDTSLLLNLLYFRLDLTSSFENAFHIDPRLCRFASGIDEHVSNFQLRNHDSSEPINSRGVGIGI